ncbi:hypothetical protein OD91_0510 [Lutibacter sp. Hel_I_33_5]|uniref:putative LPS assembly protein LptD n=1 Tax=Lutibacter sp. Hel_I_33_5 TaxID=1566289 RepID=UPI0011AD8A2F|nr:putative LPS assembly protein LptD [Lutibacter sp. Hel_I_33_5]TVZ55264.1 hypothetical protein OD91_0510 [Lutibacter sp. Hel_I_33_5]
MQSNISSYILLIFCFISLQNTFAQKNSTKKDTITSIKKDSILLKTNDTIKKDTIVKKQQKITDIIKHDAKDYKISNTKNKTLTLYNEAQIKYTDIDLKAGIIIINYDKNTLFAKGIKDSTGYQQKPIFIQGGQESEQDSLLYNFKSKRALIYGLKSQQGEMITYGEKTKRVNDSTIYIRKIRFTTSEKKNPDYYIATEKAKLVPGKKIIVGLSNLVVADVPTPFFLPFAYFPQSEKSISGFIFPTFDTGSTSRGIGFQNGGYYFAISDYFDLTLQGDAYSNGTWGFRAATNYKKRYKFNGNFSFRYENTLNSIKGFADYSKSTNYNINWRHSQDTKASPNARFSASVNIGSSTYFRESINEFNNSQFLNNNRSSSVSFYKKFVGTPFNMNVLMTHNQNISSENTDENNINLTLPSLQVNMERVYPFAGKGGVKKNPIQKMGFNYSMQGQYLIKTNDEDFFTAAMFKTAKAGIVHNTGTNTNIRAFKYFTLSPSISYKEVWNFDYTQKRFDETITDTNGNIVGGIVKDTVRGFKSFREYNTGVSLSTNIYGTFNFKKGRLKAIRHTIRPSISYGYRPNFARKYEQQIQSNLAATEFETYSPFEDGMYGSPGAGLSNSIGISVNNVLEAKVAPKDPDSDKEDEKVMILNNLNFSTSYNIAADSLRWSNVNVSAGTRLFKDKMALNLGATLNPYQVNAQGVTINKYNPNVFRVQNVNITANYSLSSKDFEKKDDKKNSQGNGAQNTPDILGEEIQPSNTFSQSSQNNTDTKDKKAKLYFADIPWSINFAYSTSYSNNGYQNIGIQNHTLMFSGSFELTPKWKVGFNSGYDIKDGAFTYSRFNFARDLDSWQFNFNWVPFGLNSSYTFFIGVKSSILQDLKWDKNKPPDRRLF